MRNLLLCLFLTACGSGAVSGPLPAPGPITITPSTAVLYSGQPTTFEIQGGTGTYSVTSSDQATIPVVSSIGHTLTIVPRAVNAESPVTLIVTDDVHSSQVTASLTVRPTTVQNTVSVTPTSDACRPGVCTGGDAEVAASLSINGQPIASSPVRFEVLSGPALFNGQPTFTTTTDAAGRARATIQIAPSVPTQTIQLRIVDIRSGSFQTASLQAVQTPAFFVTPQTITFSGTDSTRCAGAGAGATATVAIFGGSPPYRIIGGSSTLIFTRDVIPANGETFDIIPTGACFTSQPVSILDSAGHTVSVTVSNNRGTAAPTPFVVNPDVATMNDCNSQVTFTATGGNGSYLAIPANNSITQIAQSGNTFTFARKPGTTSPGSVSVTFTSGGSSTGVAIIVSSAAQGVCP